MRQLNFYGFRKIKTDAVLLKDEQSGSEKNDKYWRFKHENFQCGKPELLANIQRAAHSSPNISQEDFKKLKDEVESMRKGVLDLTGQLTGVMAIVEPLNTELESLKIKYENLQKQVQLQQQQQIHISNSKKRRLSSISNASVDLDALATASQNREPIPATISAPISATMPSSIPLERFDSLSGLSAVVDALSNGNNASDATNDANTILSLGSLGPTRKSTASLSLNSVMSLGSLGAGRPSMPAVGADDDAISLGSFSLGSNASGIEILGGVAAAATLNTTTDLVIPPSHNAAGLKNESNVERMKQISKTFGALPVALQEMLAERVLETVMMPDVWKQQVDAVATLAGIISDATYTTTSTAGSAPANTSIRLNAKSGEDLPNNLAIAIATLGTFLTSYATGNTNNWSQNESETVSRMANAAADEARKMLPMNLSSNNTNSLPLVVATLVSFLSKYTTKANSMASSNNPDAKSSTEVNDSSILHLTQQAHADKRL